MFKLSQKQKKTLITTAALIVVGWLLTYEGSAAVVSNAVYFFDVGQGDASLVRTSQGGTILIDGGPDSIVKELSMLGIEKIDLMILTHPHADHVAGLVEVLKEMEVGRLIATCAHYESTVYDAFLKFIDSCYAGPKKLNLDNATVELLYPLHSIKEHVYDNVNNSSIVTKITLDEVSVLFPGDIESEAESELLASAHIDADIVLVPHHGSQSSSSMRFIHEVSPQECIISSGKGNSYGHPHAKTMRNYDTYGTHCLRTDEQGDIIFQIQGKALNRI